MINENREPQKLSKFKKLAFKLNEKPRVFIVRGRNQLINKQNIFDDMLEYVTSTETIHWTRNIFLPVNQFEKNGHDSKKVFKNQNLGSVTLPRYSQEACNEIRV